MVFMQCITVILLCLLLMRSINHDNRMGRLERFVGKVVASIIGKEQENETLMNDQIFSGDTIDNAEEVDADGKRSDEEQREDF